MAVARAASHTGRRSRMGHSPTTSTKEPLGLSELERVMVLTAVAGNTGWHHMITRHERYAPHLSNYSAAAGGRHLPVRRGVPHDRVLLHRR